MMVFLLPLSAVFLLLGVVIFLQWRILLRLNEPRVTIEKVVDEKTKITTELPRPSRSKEKEQKKKNEEITAYDNIVSSGRITKEDKKKIKTERRLV